MTTLSWVPRINITQKVSVTPTITAGAYTSGLQIGGIMTLTDVIRQDAGLGYGSSELVEVTILDSDKQDALFDIWLFNQSPTVTSTDHSSFAMTAANMKAQAIGYVPVGSSYSDAAAVSLSTVVNLNKPVQVSKSAANPTNVYAIAVCRGTPTFTTTTSLQFQFTFFVD